MAVRTGNFTYNANNSFDIVWLGITEADEGSPVQLPGAVRNVTVQAVGDFTTSGAVTLQGSNDAAAYSALQDPAGTDIVMTTTKVWRLDSFPARIKPVATAGTAVSMDIYMHGVMVR